MLEALHATVPEALRAIWPELALGAAAAGLALAAVLLLAVVVLQLQIRRRLAEPGALSARLDQLDRAQERGERALREELAKSREEAAHAGRHLREEVNASVKGFGDSLSRQLLALTDSNEKRLIELRGVVDTRLEQIRAQNGQKLDEMRQTVDEKLQGTLEKRLGESFQLVSERLEAVHKGLGEMQSLANGVGDLKKVLTNVKTRGTWGEIQLGELLDQVLPRDRYARNVATKPGAAERVEFAIKLPGRGEHADDVVWLPIDAKFPQEDYQRLVEAQEQGDAAAADEAGRRLEARIKLEARAIREKYVSPPHTTDFGILFLPTEGLYAEVLRRPGLADIQRDHRVTVAGPTTLAALLNSLQMGFRTLAIQQRSDEVWKLLSAVRTQFGKFGALLERVDKKLQEASNTVGDATRKTRYIERRLGRVEELPEHEARALLPGLPDEE